MSKGYFAIQEALEKARVLAEWQRANRPDLKVLRLKRKDYDVIARYPKAGEMQSPDPVRYDKEGPSYMGFRLIYDGSEDRYSKKQRPEQTTIENSI